MAKQNYEELAEKVVELVGGKENITYLSHCVTRLRFNVKDKGLVKKDEIDAIKGVVGSQWSGDQYQIIIGQSVGDAYDLIVAKTGLARQDAVDENLDGGEEGKKKFRPAAILEYISACVTPLIHMLIGAGFLQLVVILLEQFGLMSSDSATATVLTFASNAAFYFLPIFVGATAARKLGCNMGLGMLIGAILVHPDFVSAVDAGTELSIFGLPVYSTTYSSTIFPTLLAVAVMAPVEKFFGKISPDAIRSITEPLLTLLVMIPLTLCVLAPLGNVVGTWLSDAILWLYDMTGALAVGVFTCVCPWLVMTGSLLSTMPYMLDALNTTGSEYIILTGMIISNINQGAAALAVACKTKDTDLRSTGISCAITAVVGGVTEPAMYGVNLPLMTPMYGAMIGGLAGGLVSGFLGAGAHAITGSAGIFGVLSYLGGDFSNVLYMLAGIAVGFVVTFVATWLLYKPEEADTAKAAA